MTSVLEIKDFIITFMRKHPSCSVKVENIYKVFADNQRPMVDETISAMLREGVLFEPEHGKVRKVEN